MWKRTSFQFLPRVVLRREAPGANGTYQIRFARSKCAILPASHTPSKHAPRSSRPFLVEQSHETRPLLTLHRLTTTGIGMVWQPWRAIIGAKIRSMLR